MTQAQQYRYVTALTRAKEGGVYVCGQGTCHAANNPMWVVNSSRDPNVFYQVIQRGDILSCSCPAGRRGDYCMHRATVTAHLIAKARQQDV